MRTNKAPIQLYRSQKKYRGIPPPIPHNEKKRIDRSEDLALVGIRITVQVDELNFTSEVWVSHDGFRWDESVNSTHSTNDWNFYG